MFDNRIENQNTLNEEMAEKVEEQKKLSGIQVVGNSITATPLTMVQRIIKGLVTPRHASKNQMTKKVRDEKKIKKARKASKLARRMTHNRQYK